MNPARATRPIASAGEKINNTLALDSPRLQPSSSEENLRAILSESPCDNRVHLYTSREASSTEHLPQDLRTLIHNSFARNPFGPPSKLVSSVVPLPKAILDNVNIGPHVFPGANSKGSSLLNVELEEKLPESLQTKDTNADVTGCVISKAYDVMSLGEASLFMNLFPFAGGHTVITLSEAPYVSLCDFTVRQLRDSLCLAVEYIRSCAKVAWNKESYESTLIKGGGEPNGMFTLSGNGRGSMLNDKQVDICKHRRLVWPNLVWNYMPSSAGSLIHPHWQCFVEPQPVSMTGALIHANEEWMDNEYGPEWRSEPQKYKNYQQCLYEFEKNLSLTKEDALRKVKNHETGSYLQRSRYIGCVPVGSTAEAYDSTKANDSVPVYQEPLVPGQYVVLVAPFAARISHEIHCFFANVHTPTRLDEIEQYSTVANISDLSGLSPAQMHAISVAIATVCRGYTLLKVGAMNMTVTNGPAVSALPCVKYSRDGVVDSRDLAVVKAECATAEWIPDTIGYTTTLIFKLNSRPTPTGIYTTDTGPLERMLDTFAVNHLPEDCAELLRNEWDNLLQSIKQ